MTKNEFSSEMKDLKRTYFEMKKKGGKERLEFLDSIVCYCEFLGFSKDQILIFLGVVRNCEPDVDQTWNDVDNYDAVDIEYNKNFLEIKE